MFKDIGRYLDTVRRVLKKYSSLILLKMSTATNGIAKRRYEKNSLIMFVTKYLCKYIHILS